MINKRHSYHLGNFKRLRVFIHVTLHTQEIMWFSLANSCKRPNIFLIILQLVIKALDNRLMPWITGWGPWGACKSLQREWCGQVCVLKRSLWLSCRRWGWVCVCRGDQIVQSLLNEDFAHDGLLIQPLGWPNHHVWPGPKPDSHSTSSAKAEVKAARLRFVAWGRFRCSAFLRVACRTPRQGLQSYCGPSPSLRLPWTFVDCSLADLSRLLGSQFHASPFCLYSLHPQNLLMSRQSHHDVSLGPVKSPSHQAG